MTPVYAILTDSASIDIMEKLPLIVAAVAAAVLLITFFVGFFKGFRRVSWSGLVWLFAGTAYFLVESFLVETNPVFALLEGMELGAEITAFGASFVLALACILVSLLLYGVFSLLFRPRVKRVRRSGDLFNSDENGIEYDDEEVDYDDYENYRSTTILVRKGYGKPTVFGRIFGGLICAINAATVLFIVLAVALFFMGGTSLRDTTFAALYEQEIIVLLTDYVFAYGLDFLMIGVIVKLACKGYQNGFVSSVRSLFGTVGGLAALVLGFWLPFSAFALPLEEGGVEMLNAYVVRCEGAATAMGLPIDFAPIVGKILAGLILFVFLMLVVWLIGFLLRSLAEGIEGVGFFRVIDGALACVTYLLIGVAVCILIWAVWYALGSYGIFNVDKLFTGECLSKKLYDACGVYIQPALDTLQETLSGLIPTE